MGIKTKLAMAIATSTAGAAMIAGGTFAEFSSQASTQQNTFSSGTLQLALNPAGHGWGGPGANVGATWVSPSNWAPGQTMTATLQATDEGTIGAKHIFFSFGNISDSNPSLLSEIDVTSITETFGTGTNAKTVTTSVSNLAQQIGVTSGPLTLEDFLAHQYYTFNPNGGDVIAPGNQQDYALTIGLTFNDAAGNAYQGLTSSFDMNLNATQNTPTDGYINLQQ